MAHGRELRPTDGLMTPESGLSDGELKEAALSGARWVAAARVVLEIIAFGSALLLARLIPPAEFGRAVIALMVVTIGPMMLGVFFGTLVVQRRDLRAAHVEAAAWLANVGALVAAALVALASVLLAGQIFDDATAELLLLGVPALLIGGLAVVPQSTLQRRLDFRRLGIIDVIAALTGTAVTVALALFGLDAEAIVLGTVTGAAIGTILVMFAARIPRPRWHPPEMREIVRLGFPAGAGVLANLTFRNIDYAIVGARLGPAALGIYWRAFQLGAEYQRKISIVMVRVAFPIYARSEGLEQMRKVRRRIVRAHATVIFPLLALLVVGAPEMVPLLFGSAWEAAVVPTQILSVAGMAAAVTAGMGSVPLALGKTGRLMTLGWINVSAYALVVFLVAPLGLTILSIVVAALSIVVLLVNHYVMLTRAAGIPLKSILDDIGAPLVACLALLMVGFPVRLLLVAAGAPPVAVVVPLAVTGLAAYALALRAVSPDTWSDLKLLGRRVVERRRVTAAPASTAPAEAGIGSA